MNIQFMVQEGERWFALGDERFEVALTYRLGAPAAV
jgi:hypothetical protein